MAYRLHFHVMRSFSNNNTINSRLSYSMHSMATVTLIRRSTQYFILFFNRLDIKSFDSDLQRLLHSFVYACLWMMLSPYVHFRMAETVNLTDLDRFLGHFAIHSLMLNCRVIYFVYKLANNLKRAKMTKNEWVRERRAIQFQAFERRRKDQSDMAAM